MKVLIACEFSGIVREEFKKLGHDAWSCDLLPTEILGNHYQGNVIDIINDDWDLMIAHPPCTYLSNIGAKWLYETKPRKTNTLIGEERKLAQIDAIEFFMLLINSNIPKIAIENPVGIMSTKYRKPDQIINPWQFGDSFDKRTCLWLKNLPKLVPTDIVERGEYTTFKSGTRVATWFLDAAKLSKEERQKIRSKTFPGIARAMAEQWGQ